MQRLTDKEFNCPPYDGDRTYYIICSPPRTGSFLLCHLLTNSGVMGVPAEYFNPIFGWKFMAERLNLINNGKIDLTRYTNALKILRTTPNGVFGVKMQYWMMGVLIQNKVFSTHFPDLRFIFLTRRDKVAQGVSFDIAQQTGMWTSQHPPSDQWATRPSQIETLKYEVSLEQKMPPENEVSPKRPVYDRARILEGINFVVKEHVSWEMFFSLHDIDPYRLEYERLIENPDTICSEICDYVGTTANHRFSLDEVPIEKQRSDLNEKWIRRLKENMTY